MLLIGIRSIFPSVLDVVDHVAPIVQLDSQHSIRASDRIVLSSRIAHITLDVLHTVDIIGLLSQVRLLSRIWFLVLVAVNCHLQLLVFIFIVGFGLSWFLTSIWFYFAFRHSAAHCPVPVLSAIEALSLKSFSSAHIVYTKL